MVRHGWKNKLQHVVNSLILLDHLCAEIDVIGTGLAEHMYTQHLSRAFLVDELHETLVNVGDASTERLAEVHAHETIIHSFLLAFCLGHACPSHFRNGPYRRRLRFTTFLFQNKTRSICVANGLDSLRLCDGGEVSRGHVASRVDLAAAREAHLVGLDE